MASGKVKLTLTGFDKLLDEVQFAQGSIEAATERALVSSAKMLTQEIRKGAVERNLDAGDLIVPKAEWLGDMCSVEVGFKLGAYNPSNPSTGYKALFREYGAPSKGGNRSTKKGANRGAVAADPFIRPAVKRNQKAIRNAQKKALERILKGLKS